jgi:cobalt-precorrin-5B (C1)-methyltransferase
MPKKLKNGFTTGTAAAAAVKGALITLLEGDAPERVEIAFLSQGSVRIPLHSCVREGQKRVACSVIKDAGDDPDVTHGAEIGARVERAGPILAFDPQGALPAPLYRLRGGPGVGQVTKPGLDLPVGEPAINPGPRTMIRQAVEAVFRQSGLHCPLEIEIFVPRGESIARKTLNARLGILGGISILGTTGIVRPMSHAA